MKWSSPLNRINSWGCSYSLLLLDRNSSFELSTHKTLETRISALQIGPISPFSWTILNKKHNGSSQDRGCRPWPDGKRARITRRDSKALVTDILYRVNAMFTPCCIEYPGPKFWLCAAQTLTKLTGPEITKNTRSLASQSTVTTKICWLTPSSKLSGSRQALMCMQVNH
jgi:hypothetical protein